MNRYIGQYHCDGTWISLGIIAGHIEEAVTWMKENIQEKGIVVAQVIPDHMVHDNCWIRQGASHTEVPTHFQ